MKKFKIIYKSFQKITTLILLTAAYVLGFFLSSVLAKLFSKRFLRIEHIHSSWEKHTPLGDMRKMY